ncbi:MAG TPA: glutamine--fructose-6-phosphate transaminase (isomerizing) [Bacteroidales bacterium]|nr:glutamine--fructose-6-phosphate transaminase (isomerizing) [Bacteroidales bacterium]
MCGIVGYTGTKGAAGILIGGLEKLEYRGYDSAGIAIYNGELRIVKSPGNIESLKNRLPRVVEGNSGIAHTRWATHGRPTENNAHPHESSSGRLVMVHNGIIENSNEIRTFLLKHNYRFKSETDTEVLLNLIEYEYLRCNRDIVKALQISLAKAIGSYALVIMSTDDPEELVICRGGSPIVVGFDDTGSYIASDIYAISEYTDRFVFPENGDIIVIDGKGIKSACTIAGYPRSLEEKMLISDYKTAGKDGFDHFMLKEIYEQPGIISDLANSEFIINSKGNKGTLFEDRFASTDRITILGCGTSWHSGLIGKYIIEKYLRIPVNAEYASEYRYRHPVITNRDLVISISQSGETADTLAANRLARESGAITMGLINVMSSTLERETDFQVYINAGPEIGVASTKAYTAQVVSLFLLAAKIASLRGDQDTEANLRDSIKLIPGAIRDVLDKANNIKEVADNYSSSNNFLFLGRGLNYPTALEGALKLKEISYVHAEGFPGAEMKHGPIALIDYHFPTMAIVTDKENLSKMYSNIEEIRARSGKVIAVVQSGNGSIGNMVDQIIEIPEVPDILTPIVSAVPLQLFSYYMALNRDCNVDQPRNLAKSVTVE